MAAVPLHFDRLALSSGGQDTLLAFLLTLSTQETPEGRYESEIFHLVRLFADELKALREQCAALPAQETTARASPQSFRLASRYSVLLCASACLGIWRTQQENTRDPFLAEPAWVLAVLLRLAALCGLPRQRLSAALTETLLDELTRRYLSRQSFDLADCRWPRRRVGTDARYTLGTAHSTTTQDFFDVDANMSHIFRR
ncbi:hypothetical protein QNM99_20305 [Pseudomonas sp. PCH446]